MTIQFFYNGFKINKGPLNRCFYSRGTYTHMPTGTLTIYAKRYRFENAASQYLPIENDTDSQTDYFDDDRARIKPLHPLYPQVLAACEAYEARYAAKVAKRAA